MSVTYGAQNEHGLLKRVVMHRPGPELDRVTAATAGSFGFTAPVDRRIFLNEFDALTEALSSFGAEPVLLTDVLKNDADALAYIACRPNMTYTRDLAVVLDRGVLLMSMMHKGRKGDPWIVQRAMERLGVPILGSIEPPGFIEGGAILFLDERRMIVSLCDRATEPAILQMRNLLLGKHIDELILVPVAEGEIHIDGLLMFLAADFAVAYPPHIDLYPSTIFRKGRQPEYVILTEYLDRHGVTVFPVDEHEKNTACVNYVTVAPMKVIGYDWAERTHAEVRRRGGSVIGVPGTQLLLGNAGPHCMTLPLLKN